MEQPSPSEPSEPSEHAADQPIEVHEADAARRKRANNRRGWGRRAMNQKGDISLEDYLSRRPSEVDGGDDPTEYSRLDGHISLGHTLDKVEAGEYKDRFMSMIEANPHLRLIKGMAEEFARMDSVSDKTDEQKQALINKQEDITSRIQKYVLETRAGSLNAEAKAKLDERIGSRVDDVKRRKFEETLLDMPRDKRLKKYLDDGTEADIASVIDTIQQIASGELGTDIDEPQPEPEPQPGENIDGWKKNLSDKTKAKPADSADSDNSFLFGENGLFKRQANEADKRFKGLIKKPAGNGERLKGAFWQASTEQSSNNASEQDASALEPLTDDEKSTSEVLRAAIETAFPRFTYKVGEEIALQRGDSFIKGKIRQFVAGQDGKAGVEVIFTKPGSTNELITTVTPDKILPPDTMEDGERLVDSNHSAIRFGDGGEVGFYFSEEGKKIEGTSYLPSPDNPLKDTMTAFSMTDLSGSVVRFMIDNGSVYMLDVLDSDGVPKRIAVGDTSPLNGSKIGDTIKVGGVEGKLKMVLARYKVMSEAEIAASGVTVTTDNGKSPFEENKTLLDKSRDKYPVETDTPDGARARLRNRLELVRRAARGELDGDDLNRLVRSRNILSRTALRANVRVQGRRRTSRNSGNN